MAEVVAALTTAGLVLGLITDVTALASNIAYAAKNVRTAKKSALNLANRVEIIKDDIHKIEDLPNNHQQAFVHHLTRLQGIFEDVEHFLKKMQRTGVGAKVKRILKSYKYEQRCRALFNDLDSAVVDFIMALNVNGQIPEMSFLPTVPEIAPNTPATSENEVSDEPNIDVKEEPTDFEPLSDDNTVIPWSFEPRPKIGRNRFLISLSDSANVSFSSTSSEISQNGRKDLDVRTHNMRNVPQNTRISNLRIVLSKLKPGDTSPLILRIQKLLREMRCHYCIEFQLEDGTEGTIENCVDDVHLYEGTSKRTKKHTVLVADLKDLDINKTLFDLVQLRNDHRSIPYNLMDNNFKHFAFNALTELIGDFRCWYSVGRSGLKKKCIKSKGTFSGFCLLCHRTYTLLKKQRSSKPDVIVRAVDGTLIWGLQPYPDTVENFICDTESEGSSPTGVRPTTNVKKVRKKARWNNKGRKIVRKHERRREKVE